MSKRFCEENLQLLFSVLFPKNGKGQLQGATQVGPKARGLSNKNMGMAQLITDDEGFGEYPVKAHVHEAKVTGISPVRSISADVLSLLIQLQ